MFNSQSQYILFNKIPVDPPFVTTEISTKVSYLLPLILQKNMDDTKVSDPGPASWMIKWEHAWIFVGEKTRCYDVEGL